MNTRIARALISVSNKDGIIEFVRFLVKQGIEILSTGGTATLLRQQNLPVIDVSEFTGLPEMLDGRVKTLHPKIHGGLLGRRDLNTHQQQMADHDIQPIDLVIVNLYPFEATVAAGKDAETCIENIDIGGPSMIRSAAKNHEAVTVIVDPSDYYRVQEEIIVSGNTSIALRKELAMKAYMRTANYDHAISSWFSTYIGTPSNDHELPEKLPLQLIKKESLRYGENAHQKAALYTDTSSVSLPGIASATKLQGKELSYNNIHDADAALMLVCEFEKPTVAIIKHTNPCGIASASTLLEAYEKALSCDPVSAFGGIIACNAPIDEQTAIAMSALFLEVIISPEISAAAQAVFSKKKNLRVLSLGRLPKARNKILQVKSIYGGYLVQENDYHSVAPTDIKIVTKRQPSEDELRDLLFAFRVCKHVKSNAIVLASNERIIGVGAGQMSRVDSVRIAVHKASETEEGRHELKHAVLASDAFFPFADGVRLAAEAGIQAMIQPGGSVRDLEVFDAADEHLVAMVLSGSRHFKH